MFTKEPSAPLNFCTGHVQGFTFLTARNLSLSGILIFFLEGYNRDIQPGLLPEFAISFLLHRAYLNNLCHSFVFHNYRCRFDSRFKKQDTTPFCPGVRYMNDNG